MTAKTPTATSGRAKKLRDLESAAEYFIDRAAEDNSHAIRLDGLDAAVIGTGNQYTKQTLLIYSARLIIEIFMTRDGMSEEDAIEFFDHNVACLWAGKGTPIIVADF